MMNGDRMMGGLVVALLCAAGAGAQTMTEYGAAAGGSTAGVAMGKKASDTLGNLGVVLGGAAGKTTNNTREVPLTKVGAAPVAGEALPAPAPPKDGVLSEALWGAPTTKGRGPAGRISNNDEAPSQSGVVVQSPAPVQTSSSAPAPAPASVSSPMINVIAEFQKVAVGQTRSEIISRLGAPYSRISMPEDGHLYENFRYAVQGEPIGLVKLTDGVVSEVQRLR